MYTIKRENLQPYGELSLPALDLFTEKDWRVLDRFSEKHKAEKNKEGKVEDHQLALASARVMAELARHYEGWDFKVKVETEGNEDDFEQYTADRFITALKESPDDLPTNFVYWLSKHLHYYIRRVKDPNDLAAS